MRHDRRAFLGNAFAGVAAIGGLGFPNPDARRHLASLQATDRIGDRERKELIAEARFGRKTLARSGTGMAISSHPLATREAVNVLQAGGNACDAALCVAITQTVIQPHLVGITGYLTLTYYEAASGKTMYVDGSANVPLGATPPDGTPDTWGGAGVPGFWAGFEESVSRFGTKPKTELMVPAIRYAREGFETHPFLWGEIFMESEKIGRSDAGLMIYMPDSAIPRPGEMLYQVEAADTLEHLAERGNQYFYRGDFAGEFCRISRESGRNVTRQDMERYEATTQEAASSTYRGYEVRALPTAYRDFRGYALPVITETLDVLELLDIRAQGPPTESPETMYQMIRSLTIVEGDYLRDGSNSLDHSEVARRRLEQVLAGEPGHEASPASLPEDTCAITVADEQGNVACVVHSSNQAPFETGLWVKGVNLCSLRVYGGNLGERGLVGPGGMIVFQDGAPLLAGGSPSRSLSQCMLQNAVNILDFAMPIEESVNRPRDGSSIGDRGITIEKDYDPGVRDAVGQRGIDFDVVNPWSLYHGSFDGVHFEPGTSTMTACGDPRRCSKAEGL